MSMLYLMRHAHSEDAGSSGLDKDRKLSHQGQKQAQRAAQWLAGAQPQPDLIIASPAQRTRQTALAVGQCLALPPTHIQWVDAVYEASVGDLVSILHRYWERGTLLLVGHNPGLDGLLRSAINCHRDGPVHIATQHGVLAMYTASIAALSFPANGRIMEQPAQLSALIHTDITH